jgi:DNA-binding HxlR family transcriptional regulator
MPSRRESTGVPEEVAGAAHPLGRRWILAIVYASHGGATRFNEFKRLLAGIPPRTLAQRLTELEDAGILERSVIDDRPPRVEYRLTPAGRRLRSLVRALDNCAGDLCGRRPRS